MNYVSPGDGEIPRLQPLARLEPVQPVDLEAAQAFAHIGVHTHDTRDPLTEAQAFLLKYAGLTLILLVLSVGLAMRLELRFDVACIVFATLAGAAYFVLAWGENLYTGPGVDRHRLSVGGRVLTRQIEADERVRLSQIRLQRQHLLAQRESNAFAMEQARAAIAHQSRQNALERGVIAVSDLEPPRFALEPQTLRTDPAKQAILDAIVELYRRGDDGDWVNMDEHGYIANSVPVPWGKRGGHTESERRRMLDLLHRSRVACFDDNRRAWRVSVKLFPDADSAILAVGGVGGP